MQDQTFRPGDRALSRDGHPVEIVRITSEEGAEFAWIKYTDGHLPFDVNGRVCGTEEDPVWEHRVIDGLVIPSGGNYWNPEDWVLERGLQPVMV